MRSDIARPPSWLLLAWTLVIASLMFAGPPSVSQPASNSAAFDTHTSVTRAVPGTLSNMFAHYDGGPEDNDSVLEARDFTDASELISAGFEYAQYCVPHVGSRCWRAGHTVRTRHFDTTARTEPRFLRYSRLLN